MSCAMIFQGFILLYYWLYWNAPIGGNRFVAKKICYRLRPVRAATIREGFWYYDYQLQTGYIA